MSLESVDDVHSSDGSSLGVFGVSDSITNDGSQEALEHVSDLLVDGGGDSLHTTSSGQSSDCGLGDAHDDWSLVLVDLSLLGDLSSTLSISFSAFACTCHCYYTPNRHRL